MRNVTVMRKSALVLLSVGRFKAKSSRGSVDIVKSSKCMETIGRLTRFPPVQDKKDRGYDYLPLLLLGKKTC